jgi:hypothetical protein
VAAAPVAAAATPEVAAPVAVAAPPVVPATPVAIIPIPTTPVVTVVTYPAVADELSREAENTGSTEKFSDKILSKNNEFFSNRGIIVAVFIGFFTGIGLIFRKLVKDKRKGGKK